MEVRKAQATRPYRLPKLLSPEEIDQVDELGMQLLREVDGAEVRYDAGMFQIVTEEQVRFSQTEPFFQRKFPRLASQIQRAARRAERADKLSVDCGVEVRSYGRSNAWHVAYLQASGLLERRLPGLLSKLRAAVLEADRVEGWGLLQEPFNVRCAEYHCQRAPSSALPDTRHYDEGSLVTIDILLNEGFRGGDFSTLEPNGRLEAHDLSEAGDALVFVSHKFHCVSPLTWGQRRVLVLEFWRGPARHCPHRCATPAACCPLEVAFSGAACSHRGIHRWCTETCSMRGTPEPAAQQRESKALAASCGSKGSIASICAANAGEEVPTDIGVVVAV